MNQPVPRLRRLIRELRRRKVFRVTAVYAVAAWLTVQIAATTFPALQLPGWTVTFVIVIAALGFPVAIALSWAFEVRPERSDGATGGAAATGADERTGRVAGSEAGGDHAPPAGLRPELPRPNTPFVGRGAEVAEIERLLGSDDCRIVTVCGPGGVGKTRFALEAAARVEDRFADGAAFIPLHTLSESSPLFGTIAERLHVPSAEGSDVRARLLWHLRDRSMLLVLDNFEHLTQSAGLLTELLDGSRNLKLLVTSRERLGLRGEHLFPLDGLEVSGTTATGGGAAVRLFVESARRVAPAFHPTPAELDTVAGICEAVGGLPLAIELASAWVRALPCDQILKEIHRDQDFLADAMRDVPERHRSLRSTFESAWRLLDDSERRSYRRLSIFHGSFDFGAAAAVCDAPVWMLSSLLDKSLLHSLQGGRFEILEVLRQNAERKLAEDPDESARIGRRHAAHFAAMVRTLAVELGGAGEKAALDRLSDEISNVRSAWAWAVDQREPGMIGTMIPGMFAFYESRGRPQEGWALFSTARETVAGATPSGVPVGDPLAARLSAREAVLAAHLGKATKAKEQLDTAIATMRAANDPDLAFALDRRGVMAYDSGAYDQAKRFFEEALELARATGAGPTIAAALMHLGSVEFAAGDYAQAEQLYAQAIARFEAAGDRHGIANCHRNVGIVAAVQERYDDADRAFAIGLEVDRELDNARGIATSLQNLGTIASMRGEMDRATIFLQEAASISRERGMRKLLAASLNMLANVATEQRDAGAAEPLYREALSVASEIGETPLMLEVLVGMAQSLASGGGDRGESLRLVHLVLQHPAADSDTRAQAERLQVELGELVHARDEAGIGQNLPLDAEVAALLATRTTPQGAR
jgi:predicted ATPase